MIQRKIYTQKELNDIVSTFVLARNSVHQKTIDEHNSKLKWYCVVCGLMGLAFGCLVMILMG